MFQPNLDINSKFDTENPTNFDKYG